MFTIDSSLAEIKLQPNTSAYDIGIEIHVDGTRKHKLPTLKKGRALDWTDLCLPCDVYDNSVIAIQVTEIHTVRNRVGQATYRVSQAIDQGITSIGASANQPGSAIAFLSEEETERAYSAAFDKSQQLEKRPGMVEKAGKVGDAFKALLALGSTMAELDPTGGAKVAFSVCTKAWECLEQQEKQDASLDQLVEDIAGMIPSVESIKGVADDDLSQTVTAMLNLVEDVSVFILSFRSSSSIERAWRAMISSESEDQINAYTAKFRGLRKQFNTRVDVQALRASEVREMHAKLKPVGQAVYNPDRQCIPGTRGDIIDDLASWAQKPDSEPRLAWVHGPAGFGKSSIATSVCMRLDGRLALASSFFCKRDSPELREPHQALTTIAYQLSLRCKPYSDALIAAIKQDPELCSRHLQPLYDALFDKPLRGLARDSQSTGVLVVVVDALDECGETSTRKQLLTCLQKLSGLVTWLRIIVTSRPDQDIQEFFGSTSSRFTEYDVRRHDASADIQVFVQAQMGNVTQVDGWPSDAIERVSRQASGMFIWARTACKFIIDGFDRLERLQLVLAGSQMADIDSLYTTAVKASVPDSAGDNMNRLRQCLGAVVVTSARAPLSVVGLASLLRGRVSQSVLERVVGSLSSVLYTDQKLGGAIRIFHPSFMDYITDPSRSKDLCVAQSEQNIILAECCIDTMTESLKFNICGLETSDRFNSDVQDIDNRVLSAIPPHLSYSCLYWSSHVASARADSLEARLQQFLFGPKLLYWIEALSLLGKLSTAPPGLLALMGCCLQNGIEDCYAAASDAYRFVLSFYDTISRSTPHLYVSALAFAPSSSGIVLRAQKCFTKLLTIVEGAEKDWTPCLRTISVSSETRSTAYSPDGRRIVSGSQDGKVRIWDAEIGDAVLDPLTGHSSEVLSVAFSPDGHWIVSGSDDKTIRVWDAEAGRARGDPLRGHEGSVHSVAFSPNGCQIASASTDKTVCTWDTETGQSILVLSGHSDWVWSVAFSPDGRRLVSGSSDYTLRIWDAETGASVLEPLLGHSGTVIAVAFSPDGHHIVSGSADNSVRIWDATTGQPLLGPLLGHSSHINSVAFSANSQFIVSGSGDNTVRIWDAQTGAAASLPLDGHSGSVISVAFSSDGSRVVSGSMDKTMRIWDVVGGSISGRTQESTQHNGHSGAVNSVAISPNGQRIASGSDDKTVRVWDAETGTPVLGPLEGHTDEVQAVAFSSDSRRIASGSRDHTLRIWDSETGMPVLDPLRGHSAPVQSVAFSPDCRLIASGSYDGTIRIWDAETGRAVIEPLTGHSHWVTCVAFSADGRQIVSGSFDNTVRIWDAETGETVLGPLTGHSHWVTSVSFSPDGRRIVSGSYDKTVRIWDVETGNPVQDPLEGHTSSVHSVAFSSDSRWIVSGSYDYTVRIWDAETGNSVLEPLLGHSNWVSSVAFSSDGRRIVSGSWDMTVRIWDAELHTGSRDKTPRLLPGTQTQIITQEPESNRVLANSVQLARRMHPEVAGWVTSTEGKPIVWLPQELRDIDDSIVCISSTRIRRRIVVDFTNFVHGTSWTSIADALD
ncbi:POC1 centriolar protein A [Ceratobasidium sp. 428]|nr:POC1 centriolar protein A [Ceratobasidium sp. 428]